MLIKAKETLTILRLTRVRLIDDEIRSTNDDLSSPGEDLSNTPHVDGPDLSQVWYTHPPHSFYCRARVPSLSPFSPILSTTAVLILQLHRVQVSRLHVLISHRFPWLLLKERPNQ